MSWAGPELPATGSVSGGGERMMWGKDGVEKGWGGGVGGIGKDWNTESSIVYLFACLLKGFYI